MAVKIKLKRLGKIRNPQYRIIVADARAKRDGRAIEEIGVYQPKQDPSLIRLDSERAQYWLSVGAQPTEAVAAIMRVTGDWQRFKGEPGAEGTLRVAPAKADKMDVFNAAVADSAAAKSESGSGKAKKAKVLAQAEESSAAEAPTTDSASDPVSDSATELAAE